MHDIFLSYSREDIDYAKGIADQLEKKGFSVWWDRKIQVGTPFDEVIENAIDNSKCVVIIWSKNSVISQWVRAEAEEGRRRKILAPVLLEYVKIPLVFRNIHTANLINWRNDPKVPAFQKLIHDIELKVSKDEIKPVEDYEGEVSSTSVKNSLRVQDFNIHVDFPDGSTKQITFNESDENPIFVNNNKSIVFTRNLNERFINRVYTRKKLMIVSVDDLKENLITERKPYKDGNDNSHEIFSIINPTVSIDGKHIYFSVEKSATGNQVVKINIENGKWTELFPGNLLEYVRYGAYKGSFLIAKSEIRHEGREGYYAIVDEKGGVKKDFKDKKSAMSFMKVINSSY
jgi:hypothetical protein